MSLEVKASDTKLVVEGREDAVRGEDERSSDIDYEPPCPKKAAVVEESSSAGLSSNGSDSDDQINEVENTLEGACCNGNSGSKVEVDVP